MRQPTLEDQEKHLLVKVIDSIPYKLDELVRPFVHKILVVIEQLLIDENYYARVEGREIISNFSKAAGLATMIAAMRPDIDNIDEYVRNTTARAFSVVASALGIPALLPFLKAVCQSKKSLQARHTGIKNVQQIAILIGCALLLHLRSLVEIIEHGLSDENHKKGIRRATVITFGYIAKVIGPQDVLATLLNNLKVQERQNRVCTTVAVAVVAETSFPFTVLPALMNEYRVPELNVQNGVLKSLSFLFEYNGEMDKYFIYEVTPLLEDALIDRDLVHRQTAASAVKHMALGVAGLGCENALVHLLNLIWPSIFETSPYVINALMEGIKE